MATISQAMQDLLDSPAMAAPPGLKHNFVDPPNLKTEFYVDLSVCLIISILAVCIRMWTKVRLIRKVEIEDYVCFLALAMFAGYCGYLFHTVQVEDAGAHQWNIQLKILSRHLYITRVVAIIYGFIILAIKIAILLHYLRIFSTRRDTTFWVYHILIWLHVVYYIICAFLGIFSCNPVEKYWIPWTKGGHCVNFKAMYIVSAFFNSISDIFIFIMPQKVIWNLQMSFEKKIGVSAIFLVGFLACISSLVRLYYSVKLLKTDDLTYYIALCALWTLPEMASAFLAVSLPVFPKFFRNLSGLHPFSWITISERYLFRSSKTAHFQPLPNNFVLPTNQPKKSIVLPAKQDSPVYKPTVSLIGTSASDQDPVDNSSKLKTGNSRYQI